MLAWAAMPMHLPTPAQRHLSQVAYNQHPHCQPCVSTEHRWQPARQPQYDDSCNMMGRLYQLTSAHAGYKHVQPVPAWRPRRDHSPSLQLPCLPPCTHYFASFAMHPCWNSSIKQYNQNTGAFLTNALLHLCSCLVPLRRCSVLPPAAASQPSCLARCHSLAAQTAQ